MKIAAVLVLLLSGWIGWDLLSPGQHDLRDFDGHEVGRLETAMWRSYSDHQPVRLFSQLAELLREQYAFPFWRSYVGAFQAARAAEVFQAGHGRSDYMRALPHLVSYYGMIRKTSTTPFDVNKTAVLELEWWIIHRERARHEKRELDQSLADLQAEIYRQPAGDFAEHASARAEAMLLRDERAASGSASSISDGDWNRIGGLLDTSWTSIRKAVASTRQ